MERPDLRALLGKPGCGKSTLARAWASDARRVLIFDTNGEASNATGAHVVTDRVQLPALLKTLGGAPFRICWRAVHAARPDDMFAAFEWGNRCALAAGDITLIWDEADRLTGGRHLDGAAYEVVNHGRHFDLHLFAQSRRPRNVPRDLTSLCNRIAAFRTTEPDDVKYLRDTMGACAMQLPALGDHDFLDWNDSGAFTLVRA